MSITISVTIPLDTAAAIKHMQYPSSFTSTADSHEGFALETACLAVVKAVKALPYTFTASDFPSADINHFRIVSNESQSTQSTHSDSFPSPDSSEISEPFELRLFSPTASLSSRSSIGDFVCEDQAADAWSYTPDKTTFEEDLSFAEENFQEDLRIAERRFEEHFRVAEKALSQGFTIDIDDGRGSVLPVMVDGDMTVLDLQTTLERLCSVPVEQQKLVWRGYRLNQPDASLHSYGIRFGEKITLVRHLLPSPAIISDAHGIFFQDPQFDFSLRVMPSEKNIPVEARDDVTTAELASAIAEEVGIAEKDQRLIFRGKVVYDGLERETGGDAPIWMLGLVDVGQGSEVQLHVNDRPR